MEIREIWTPAGIRRIPSGRLRRNHVHLLTGPNGSGKTETLNTLVSSSHGLPGHLGALSPRVLGDGPARIISQTFSPFSRFPAPAPPQGALTDSFGDHVADDLTYTCIGLHRTSRFVGIRLTKQIIEQAIYRLSEGSEGIGAIFQVLRALDLRDQLVLKYTAIKSFRTIAAERGNRFDSIHRYLSELTYGSSQGYRPFIGPLKRQLQQTNLRELAELIGTAFDITERLIEGHRLVLDLNGAYRKSLDFALLQSLALLRRVRLLELKSCEITAAHGHQLDVARASSGQQQMLCSIIGLAAALRDNTLVVVDEPELSLHPRWQQSYVDHLEAALAPHKGCHVFVATHSPLIVQRALEKGIAILQMGEADANVDTVNKRQPPSVEGALLDVFETPIAGSSHFANQLLIAVTEGTSSDSKARAMAKQELERLRAIYSNSPQVEESRRELLLIADAIELVNASDVDDE